ncbi:hypothetical protein DSM104299_04926 [Baekduia alba]|nr:hypothetical protein DSM104299_04926 [Baekduia alba]
MIVSLLPKPQAAGEHHYARPVVLPVPPRPVPAPSRTW